MSFQELLKFFRKEIRLQSVVFFINSEHLYMSNYLEHSFILLIRLKQ